MTKHGWVENGECLFEIERVSVSGINRDAFHDTTWAKRAFQFALDNNQSVGVVFLPKGEGLTKEGMAVLSIMLGRNHLIPEHIDKIIVVSPPKNTLKFDLRRKICAYPNVEVMLDLAYDGCALYPAGDFSYKKGQWNVSERFDTVDDTPYSQACSMQAIMEAEEELICAIENRIESRVSILIEKLAEIDDSDSLNDTVDKFVANRSKEFEEGKRIYNLLCAGHLPPLPLRNPSSDEIASKLGSISPRENGFCAWHDGYWQSKKGWYADDDFGNSTVEVLSRIRKWYLLPDAAAYVAELESATEQVRQVRTIWDQILQDCNSPFLLPARLSRREATDADKELASKTMRFISDTYGISSALDAYAAGVPMADIFA